MTPDAARPGAGTPDRSASVGAHRQDTPEGYDLSPTRGALVHLGPDLERVALDVLDRLGPARARALAAELVAVAEGVGR